MKTSNTSDLVTQHLRALATAEAPGARLPSVRGLMREFGVGPATVQQALDRLTQEGVVEAHPGRGTFVSGRLSESAAQPADTAWQSLALGTGRVQPEALRALALMPAPHVVPLNAGYLPEALQASALLATAATRAQRQPGLWSRMPTEGLYPLRAWFAETLGGDFRPHEVTICPGSQSALAASFRALANAGDPVLMESPTYLGAIAAAVAAGLRPVPVPIDRDGVRPELLADAFRATGARLFYCQPTYANPTGAVLSVDRRGPVLELLREFGAFLIEDDWARDFSFAAPPPPTLAAEDRDGHVVYVRSLTKCAAPGLRIGALCARGPALGRLRAARLTDDFFVPGLLQEIALQLLTSSGWPRHLRGVRAALRTQRDALASALREHLGPVCLAHLPEGGLHLWVRLPDGVSDEDVAARCARADILVSAGRHWFPADPAAPHLRVSFAAIPSEMAEDVIGRLAAVIRAG
ncbi:MAG: aminotransferase-like domain-containing protein [Acidiphilium sp.]